MGIKRTKARFAYDIGETFVQLAPLPVISQRNPGTTDFCELGTTWINVATMGVYINASNADGIATWLSSPAGGSGVFNTLEATTGNITADLGNVVITTGNLDVVAGNATIAGTLLVGGLATFNGGLDLTSAGEIILQSTLDSSPSIALIAAGGTSEQILIHSTEGTGGASVKIVSDEGGIELLSGLAAEDAIGITASAGGIELTADEAIALESAQDAANAIGISATGTDGGVTFTAGTAGFIYSSTGDFFVTSTSDDVQSIYLVADAGTAETIEIKSTLGTSAGSILIHSLAGGIEVTSALDTVITSTHSDATAITLKALTGGGGVTINAAAGGFDFTTSGDILLQSTVNNSTSIIISEAGGPLSEISILSTAGTGPNSVSIGSILGGITLLTGSASATSINLTSTIGGIVTTSALNTVITSTNTTAAAISLTASGIGGGILLTSSTGGVEVTSTGSFVVNTSGLFSSAATVTTTESPSNAATINANVGVATFTGFSTAAAADQSFVITNSLVSATSGILITVSNTGTNVAFMSLSAVHPAAGSFTVITTNVAAAAALNGNVIITFWVIAP